MDCLAKMFCRTELHRADEESSKDKARKKEDDQERQNVAVQAAAKGKIRKPEEQLPITGQGAESPVRKEAEILWK